VRPLFGASGSASHLPFFSWDPASDDDPDGMPAQVRGRLWRFPSGEIALSLDPKGPWIEGTLVAPPDPGRSLVWAALAGVGARGLTLRTTRARVGMRALTVVTWAGEASDLDRMGALPLRIRDPARAR
jgi:hypothetical protein